MTYLGTTTSNCDTRDYVNVISAPANCGTGCDSLGQSQQWGTAEYTEADVCLYGHHDWDIEADLLEGDVDLLGTLTHEFGHAIGFEHGSDGCTMQQTIAFGGDGNTLKRHPCGDDIDGMRAMYSHRTLEEFYREFTESSETLGTEYDKAGGIGWSVAGTIARVGGNWTVFRAATAGVLSGVWVDWTAYPLSSTTPFSWSNRFLSYPTDYVPAIASSNFASPNPGRLIVAAPGSIDTAAEICNGVRFWRSDDGFTTTPIASTVADICTNHGVAVAYDPSSARWILAYVAYRQDGEPNENDQAQIFFRTSADGTTWNVVTEVDSGFYTTEAPSLACNSSDGCMVGFVDAGTDKPTARNVALSVSNLLVVTGASNHETNSFTARTPVVGVTSNGDFFQWLWWSGSYSNIAQGRASLYTVDSTTNSITYSSWTSLGETSQTRPGVAFSYERTFSYALYGEFP